MRIRRVVAAVMALLLLAGSLTESTGTFAQEITDAKEAAVEETLAKNYEVVGKGEEMPVPSGRFVLSEEQEEPENGCAVFSLKRENTSLQREADTWNYTVSDTITAVLDPSSGALTIKGTGDMPDYYDEASIPWYADRYFVQSVMIEEGITKIGRSAFYGCYNLKSADVAESVRSISDGVFANAALETITGMEGVESIGDYAFQGCYFTEFTFPERVKTIENHLFYDCQNLTKITIAANVESVGYNIAFNTPSLTEIAVADGNTHFCTEDGILYDTAKTTLYTYPQAKEGTLFIIPETVTTLAPYCFGWQEYLTEILFSKTVTTIEEGAFFGMQAIDTLSIPSSVTSVGDFAFEKSAVRVLVFDASIEETPYEMCRECERLTKVVLKNEMLTVIYNRSFALCTSLTEVQLPAKLKRLEDASFQKCESLKQVQFPASVVYISASAFLDSGVIEFPDWLTDVGNGDRILLANFSVSGTERYDMSYEVLMILNQERTAAGLTPLDMDQELLEAAMQRGAEAAVSFSHTRPSGASCFTVCAKMTAENIAVGDTSAKNVMNTWMNSTGHRGNILASDHRSIGIGCFYHNGTFYWVQCFGSEEASAGEPQRNKSVKRKIAASPEKLNPESLLLLGPEEEIAYHAAIPLEVSLVNPEWPYTPCVLNVEDFEWISDKAEIAEVNDSGAVTVKGGKTGDHFTITARLRSMPSVTANYTGTVGKVISLCYGDVDMDGTIAATDALNILKHVVRLAVLTDETALELADVDHDETVAAADALGVLKVVVHLQEKEIYTGK